MSGSYTIPPPTGPRIPKPFRGVTLVGPPGDRRLMERDPFTGHMVEVPLPRKVGWNLTRPAATPK